MTLKEMIPVISVVVMYKSTVKTLLACTFLFSHFRPHDASLGNSFFQMFSYAYANVSITYEKTKGKFP